MILGFVIPCAMFALDVWIAYSYAKKQNTAMVIFWLFLAFLILLRF